MAKRKRLSKRQLAVIDDLFAGQFDEQAVLGRHKVSRNTYNRWRAGGGFDEELSRRIASAQRQSELIIARYSVVAAAKLVQLTESEKEETARKACLDIISLPKLTARQPDPADKTQTDAEKRFEQLPPETAGKLLAALAEQGQASQ